MRYEGVLRAKTSVALVAGVILVLTGCGRASSHLTVASPVAEVSPSTAASPSTEVDSPAASTPSAAPTAPAQQPPSPRPSPTPSPSPRPSPSTRPSPPPLVIGSLTFPTGEVGISYPAIALTASGGTPPYTWSISQGALPPPLALSGSSISGTPNAPGPFQFTVNVADSAGVTAGAAQAMTVAPYVTFAGNCTNVCSVEQGCVTVCGGYATLGGGVAPFQYQASGTLPPGTTLNGPSLAGTFTTVSSAAPFSFAVTVTDALGAAGAVKANYSVIAQITLQGGTCSTKVGSGFGCTARLPYAGGTGKPAGVTISSQTPVPKGTTVTFVGGLVLFSVPAQTVAVNVKALVILTDSAVCGPNAGQPCTATATVIISIN